MVSAGTRKSVQRILLLVVSLLCMLSLCIVGKRLQSISSRDARVLNSGTARVLNTLFFACIFLVLLRHVG